MAPRRGVCAGDLGSKLLTPQCDPPPHPPHLRRRPQGIGKAYAKALARKGLNVVLISRSADRLAAVAAELKAAVRTPVEIRTIAADFSQAVETGLYERIKGAWGWDGGWVGSCILAGACLNHPHSFP